MNGRFYRVAPGRAQPRVRKPGARRENRESGHGENGDRTRRKCALPQHFPVEQNAPWQRIPKCAESRAVRTVLDKQKSVENVTSRDENFANHRPKIFCTILGPEYGFPRHRVKHVAVPTVGAFALVKNLLTNNLPTGGSPVQRARRRLAGQRLDEHLGVPSARARISRGARLAARPGRPRGSRPFAGGKRTPAWTARTSP